jgi:putative endonuclease
VTNGCYVYMLLARDGSLYTGIAANPLKRLAEHNAGRRGAKALRGKRPVRLLRCWLCGDRSAALRLEAELKRLRAQEKWSVVLSNDSSRTLENPRTGA